jgi:multidrug efflux pump subunit AcrA (membrane-fusion protein)
MQLRQDAPLDSDADVDRDGAQEAALRRNGTRPGRGGLREKFAEQPLLNSVLVALCIAAIVLAITAIGPASSSTGQSTRTTTVKRGVVQSTVSGSGNVQSADQLNLGFKTSGTVTQIDVKEGQHVVKGQLLATLDPKSAEVTLEQAKATLQSAEAGLAKEEETGGETASGQSAGASAASTSGVAYTAATTTTESPAPAPTTTTAPATTTPATTTPGAATRTSKPKSERSTTTPQSNSEQGSETSTGKGTAATSEQSEATREANLASAGAAVKSDKLTVENAEQAVENTKLYAPQDGTIVTLSGEVGETVSGTGTTKSSSSASATGSSSTGGSATTGGSAGGSSTTGASSSSAQGSSGSSSSFAALSDLESLQLIVALSESEIGSVHTGQIATVTIEALNGRKVGAHVVSVSQVPTSSSGAVSYDVTFQLDQEAAGLKVGMSATAEVVVKQAEGLNVATSAIKGGSVTVLRDGKREARSITTGLAGDNTTIVLSGLKAGEEVVLASATSSGSSLSSRLGSRSGRVGSSGLGGALSGGGAFPAGGPPGG